MTHLFGEEQVFLRRQWESGILPVLRPPLKHLRLFRPATIDLILTKMMRGNDEQDMQDVNFMIRHDRVTVPQIEGAFRDAVIPDCTELRDAYDRAKPTVLTLAGKPLSKVCWCRCSARCARCSRCWRTKRPRFPRKTHTLASAAWWRRFTTPK